jgi:hypothetical protein
MEHREEIENIESGQGVISYLQSYKNDNDKENC